MNTFNHIHHEYPSLERITHSDGSRVYKTPTGGTYPSVTTVTGLLKKKSIQEWRERVGTAEANKISSKAAARGTRIHGLCEKYLLNEQVDPGYFDKSMWDSIKDQLNRINNIHALEQRVYSDHLRVAGTVDCIAEYDNKLSVIDFKTSSRKKHRDDIHDYFMQCSAYAVAFEEMTKLPVNRLIVIMAVEDEDPLIFQERRDTWIEGFVDLREEYHRWKNI